MTQPRHHHHHHHRHHGRVFAGRIIVAVACLFLLAVNAMLFKVAAARPHPIPALKLVAVASLLWMFTGAWGMCARQGWARVLTLMILYVGSVGYFLAGIITLTTNDGDLVGHLQPLFIATAVYLIVSLVLTHSRHVRRLTSRAYE
jgi:hypothetical protein